MNFNKKDIIYETMVSLAPLYCYYRKLYMTYGYSRKIIDSTDFDPKTGGVIFECQGPEGWTIAKCLHPLCQHMQFSDGSGNLPEHYRLNPLLLLCSGVGNNGNIKLYLGERCKPGDTRVGCGVNSRCGLQIDPQNLCAQNKNGNNPLELEFKPISPNGALNIEPEP